MAERTAAALEVAVEIGAIASVPTTLEARGEELLRVLRRVVPYEAAQVTLVDLASRDPVALAVHGYDDAVRAYTTSTEVVDEFEQLQLHLPGPPMRLRDLPVAPAEVRGWVEYLEPAGFREGLALGLRTADGRVIGILGLSTDTVAHPTVAERDLIGVLAPLIAHAIDPLRTIASAAQLVHAAQAAVVLTRAGTALPLPGLPAHGLLVEGSAVLRLATEVVHSQARASFVCPYAGAPDGSGHVRITVVACAPQPPQHLLAVVAVSPAGALDGLTTRELQVLGLIIEGWPNRRIAATLGIAQRTAASHVEHILVKLGARSRALAAVRALGRGTYIPRSLIATSPTTGPA